MAYTGTGTVDDPYIPDTCADLYTLMSMAGYIELRKDFDFAQDTTYQAGVSTAIRIGDTNALATIYSSEDTTINPTYRMYRINGLKVTDNNFMYTANNVVSTFKHVFLSNCIHVKKTTATTFHSSGGTNGLTFDDCKISIAVKTNSSYNFALTASQLYYTNSSIYVQYVVYPEITSANLLPIFISSSSHCSKCCFEIHGWYTNLDVSSYDNNLISFVSNSTFYGDVNIVKDADTKVKFTTQYLTNCCFAMQMIQTNPEVTDDTIILNNRNYTSLSIANSDMIDSQNLSVTDSNTLALCTTAQMQNQSHYLEQIGFLL